MDYDRLYSVVPKPVSQWRSSDVVAWLLFIQLPQIIPAFEAQVIDGHALRSLNEVDIVDRIGVRSRIILKKLLNWIIIGLEQYDQAFEQLQQQAHQQNLLAMQVAEKTQHTEYPPIPQKPINMVQSSKRKLESDILILKRSELKERFYYKFSDRDCRIGCSPNCDVHISGDNVESIHAQINYRNGSYFLRAGKEDAHVYFKVDNRTQVYDGMEVEMGSNLFKVSLDDDLAINIRVIEGKNPQATFKFERSLGKVFVGRKITNQIKFPTDITLSNLHARFLFCDGCWQLEDFATTNGTWVKLSKQTKMYSGLIFKLGLTNHQFECEVKKIKTSLSKEKTNEEEESIVYVQKPTEECTECKKNIKNILYLPCNHCLVCDQCAPSIKVCQLLKFRSVLKYLEHDLDQLGTIAAI